jgi:hypothetical protein
MTSRGSHSGPGARSSGTRTRARPVGSPIRRVGRRRCGRYECSVTVVAREQISAATIIKLIVAQAAGEHVVAVAAPDLVRAGVAGRRSLRALALKLAAPSPPRTHWDSLERAEDCGAFHGLGFPIHEEV